MLPIIVLAPDPFEHHGIVGAIIPHRRPSWNRSLSGRGWGGWLVGSRFGQEVDFGGAGADLSVRAHYIREYLTRV